MHPTSTPPSWVAAGVSGVQAPHLPRLGAGQQRSRPLPSQAHPRGLEEERKRRGRGYARGTSGTPPPKPCPKASWPVLLRASANRPPCIPAPGPPAPRPTQGPNPGRPGLHTQPALQKSLTPWQRRVRVHVPRGNACLGVGAGDGTGQPGTAGRASSHRRAWGQDWRGQWVP